MLSHLYVRDLVIVRELALDLQHGMTALTGETGAGKSILIDALGLALGAKADKDMIRSGCEQAEVAASFDLTPDSAANLWLDEHELAQQGECVLRRVLSSTGRAKAWINGRPVPQQQLSELGDLLIDIHGQHEHQGLLRSATQRDLLDAYAHHPALLSSVSTSFEHHRQLSRRLEELEHTSAERMQRMDYLDFQITELERLSLAEGEYDDLVAEQTRLANAEQLLTELSALVSALDDDDAAILPALSSLQTRLNTVQRLDKQLDECAGLIDSARIQLDEAASLLRNHAESITLDPERLLLVDARLGEIHNLARKHRLKPSQLPGLLQQLTQERDQLAQSDQDRTQLEAQVRSSQAEFQALAEKLSSSRQQAARKLSQEVTSSMQGLAMAGGRFEVMITPAGSASKTGIDQVEYWVSANPGQPLAPLAKVASGGELSRISLAIQVATSAYSAVPSLIFDEVDVGIGGAVAEIVGQLLRRLGEQRQVLCVTHLPQVAAQAHHQLQVSKSQQGQSTATEIRRLDKEQRIQEIARMLGGQTISPQALAHAREMLGISEA